MKVKISVKNAIKKLHKKGFLTIGPDPGPAALVGHINDIGSSKVIKAIGLDSILEEMAYKPVLNYLSAKDLQNELEDHNIPVLKTDSTLLQIQKAELCNELIHSASLEFLELANKLAAGLDRANLANRIPEISAEDLLEVFIQANKYGLQGSDLIKALEGAVLIDKNTL